jgi:hypothetical protein
MSTPIGRALICVALLTTACASYPTASPGPDDFQGSDHEEWQALQRAAGPNAAVAGMWYPLEGQRDATTDVLDLRADGTYRRGDYRMFPPVFDPDSTTRAGCEIGAYLVVGERLQFHRQGHDIGPESRPGYNAIYSQAFSLAGGQLSLAAVEGKPTPLAGDPEHTAALTPYGPTVYSKTAHLKRR